MERFAPQVWCQTRSFACATAIIPWLCFCFCACRWRPGCNLKDDPKSVVDLQKKFNQMAGTFAIACGDGIVCHVVEGPQFFLPAPTNAGSVLADQAVLGHGGGVWLLDAKASKAIQDWPCQNLMWFVLSSIACINFVVHVWICRRMAKRCTFAALHQTSTSVFWRTAL